MNNSADSNPLHGESDFTTTEELETTYGDGDASKSELNKPLLIIGYGLVIIVTVAGNLLVIMAFCRYQRVRAIPTNTLIFSLSVCDFLTGLMVLTVNLAWVYRGYWPFGEVFCKFWSALDYTVTCMSSITIVLISLDRFLLVTQKHRYRIVWTRRRVSIICAICWTLTAAIFTVIAFSFRFDLVDYQEECELEAVYLVPATIGLLVFEFAIPFPLIVILNIVVFYQIYQRSGKLKRLRTSLGVPSSVTRHHDDANTEQDGRKLDGADGEARSHVPTVSGVVNHAKLTHTLHDGSLRPPGLPSTYVQSPQPRSDHSGGNRNLTEFRQQQTQYARHRKAAITLSILVGTYLSCWLPYEIISILQARCGDDDCFSEITWETVNGLLWSNAALNPILYGLTNPLLRYHMSCLRCSGSGGRVAPTSVHF
ncbi:5-hydroxytryptamine receptor 1F-like [Diadema setosum]|uniref:5-hydroxytryptamine receptor 1F-like n=1 Tax=Diadema setosum TaxID=31175 RepID=UPI003B3BB564